MLSLIHCFEEILAADFCITLDYTQQQVINGTYYFINNITQMNEKTVELSIMITHA